MKIKLFKSVKDQKFNENTKSNITLITGLSGSGKSYLSKELAQTNHATIFQPEWLKHSKHTSEEFKPLLNSFIELHNIQEYVSNKWNNSKTEDDNELFKKYINLFIVYFLENIDSNKNYIIEGLQLFTLIDYETIKKYPIIIKGTSSIKSLKNRLKRDYQKRKNEKLMAKIKFFFRVLKESKLYQFKHRKKLNEFIKKYENKGTTL